jgi:hypothetical protein
MWPGTDMVARVVIEERERKIARAEVLRTLRAEDLRAYEADDPLMGFVLVFAFMVVLFVGGAVLA